MTGDAEQEHFVDGMVEEITTAIARLPSLFGRPILGGIQGAVSEGHG